MWVPWKFVKTDWSSVSVGLRDILMWNLLAKIHVGLSYAAPTCCFALPAADHCLDCQGLSNANTFGILAGPVKLPMNLPHQLPLRMIVLRNCLILAVNISSWLSRQNNLQRSQACED